MVHAPDPSTSPVEAQRASRADATRWPGRQQLGEVTTAAAAIGDHLELGAGRYLVQHGEHRTPSRSSPRVVLLGDVGDAADVQQHELGEVTATASSSARSPPPPPRSIGPSVPLGKLLVAKSYNTRKHREFRHEHPAEGLSLDRRVRLRR
jgi:hypothetical protein